MTVRKDVSSSCSDRHHLGRLRVENAIDGAGQGFDCPPLLIHELAPHVGLCDTPDNMALYPVDIVERHAIGEHDAGAGPAQIVEGPAL